MQKDMQRQFKFPKFKKEIISCYRQIEIEKLRLLVLSCYSGDIQTVRTLLPVCKETINMTGEVSRHPCIDWCHYSPLAIACMGGNVGMVEELVKVGADVNQLYGRESTPLMTACEFGNASLIELVKNGAADNNLSDRLGNTPLIITCKEGHVSEMEDKVKVKAEQDA
jgi:ankyrin repeat protein